MGTTAGAGLGIKGWVLLVGVSAAVVAACDPELKPVAISADCQQDSVLILVPLDSTHTMVDTITSGEMPLVEQRADLPEFHDCQRFVVPTREAGPSENQGLEFGPLVAIWAADRLGQLFPGASARPVGERRPSRAVPVALIYNWDERVTYDPLGLRPGFNCLYLWHDAGTPVQWRAATVPLGAKPTECDASMNPEAIVGLPLEVLASAPLDTLDLPPVARWDWDTVNAQQYIGIRCGEQWCQVGAGGFRPSPSAFDAGMTLAQLKALPDIMDRASTDQAILRVFTVKGWYDEQRMDLTGPPPKTPRLTEVVGTAFPHPTLKDAPFDLGDWTTVAYLRVTGDYDGAIQLRSGISRLQLCKGDARDCRADPATTCLPKDQDPADRWWGRVISQAGDTSQVRCAKRREHGGGAIPAAAARWNWNELDAKTWVQCGGACCTVN